MDFTDLNEYVSLSKNTLELLKSAAGLLPKSPQRDSADIALKAAADALTRSDVKLAKDLGFPICQCELPGVPMLWKKRHAEERLPQVRRRSPARPSDTGCAVVAI